MFDTMTYDEILEDILSRVTSDVDKREGSVIYDAIAPCAYKLAEYYFMLSNYVDLLFPDTSVDEYLDRYVNSYGIYRKGAVYSTRKIETNTPVDIGSRFGIQETSYIIEALISENAYSAKCEQIGAIGNIYNGLMDNVDNLSGVVATLTDIIISGEDAETDDALRGRFYNEVRRPNTSGNVHDYENWALEVEGCNGAKVFPLWDGAGTVKVLVVDENMQIDVLLPNLVATYIETVRPIGATVTVESPTAKAINITANVTLDGSKSLIEVDAAFQDALQAYLDTLTFNTYSVSYARIGTILLSTAGVQDYDTLLVNSDTGNVTILDSEIPTIGTVVLTEVV